MKQTLTYLLVFIGIQFAGGAITQAAWKMVTGSPDVTATMLITSTVVVSALTITVFLWARWTEVSPNWLRSRPWMTLFWCALAALGTIVPSTWLQEQMPELPNIIENEFDMILANRWGYLTIGLLAPLAEEIVFRGAILKAMLNWNNDGQQSTPNKQAFIAIIFSALLFTLIHFNPAQMPHAFLAGLLLGWMYWRTGSILPGLCFHWVNNSIAYVLYNLYPNPDLRLIDLFHGSQQHVLMAVGFSLLILLPALYQLHIWMRRAE